MGCMAELPSGTVTFLLTDVEGSTQAWQSDAERMAVAIARHYDLLGPPRVGVERIVVGGQQIPARQGLDVEDAADDEVRTSREVADLAGGAAPLRFF